VLADLGLLRWQCGDAVDTRDLMLAAFAADPNLPEPRIVGALACFECAEPDRARELLADHARWSYLGPMLESSLATALLQLQRGDDAERRLRALLHRPKAALVARLNLIELLERVNRLDEAETMLHEAQAMGADAKQTLAARASLAARRGHHEEARALFRLELESADQSIVHAPRWCALAKSCDALGDAAGAMEALSHAHAIQMRHAVRLARNTDAPDDDPLRLSRFALEGSAPVAWSEDRTAPAADQSPIFIVGFPRSGTTLLEQMLDAHPGVKSMDERSFVRDVIRAMRVSGLAYPANLDRLDAQQLAELRDLYWRRVGTIVEMDPADRVVDKNPLNMLRLPMIKRLFPNARIVLTLRHPCDVILSNYMQDFRAPKLQILCASLERLALGYAGAMNFWIRHAELLHPDVIELRYEDLLDDTAAETDRLARFLGLDDAAALQQFQQRARAKGYIDTPSYSQVVEPLGKSAIGRWHRYREYIDPVLPTLAPLIDRWGYAA
ncbi:MAG: sulfotransferase, partial [Rhodanobacteraceae bacterium]